MNLAFKTKAMTVLLTLVLTSERQVRQRMLLNIKVTAKTNHTPWKKGRVIRITTRTRTRTRRTAEL